MKKEEEELIAKLRQGDKASFEKVVRLYTSHLYKACLGLGFRDFEAEDITQSVWITFLDVAPAFEGRSSIRTFLFGILYNKASEMRRQSRHADAADNIEEIMDSHFDESGHWILSHAPLRPDRFYESVQTKGLIAKCLEVLPLKQKMAFVLREIDEDTTEEICKVMNVTHTHLGVLLFRARNQLRECIERKSR